MIPIENDVFDIAWRIKSIDARYRLFYNKEERRYEVYIGNIRQAIIPYDTLDVRTLHYLEETHVKNIERLMKRIDKENNARERDKEYAIRKRAEDRLEEVMSCN